MSEIRNLIRNAAPLFAILMSIGWLVPNHYPPWLSAWSEGVTILSLLLLALIMAFQATSGIRVAWQLFAVAIICCAVVLVQLISGRLLFFGDAVMAVLYIGLWFLSVLIGALINSSAANHRVLDVMSWGWFLAALVSVGIALTQWTGAVALNIYAADIQRGGRPFANICQPNLFSTLCFVGICGYIWLYQQRNVGASTLFLGIIFLLFGMVMAESRTGWLQISLLVVWGLTLRERACLRISRIHLLTLGAVFLAGVVLWPSICDFLLLTDHPLDEKLKFGSRLQHWLLLLDAISREPWLGYGWLQVGAAQQRVAVDHSAVGEFISYSHNFLLDIFIWNGLPAGVLITAILILWIISNVRACHDPRVACMLLVLGGIYTHGLFEYPLAYAYFLIPVGLAMGVIDGGAHELENKIQVTRPILVTFAAFLGGVFLFVAAEYIHLEDRVRTLRFELARISGTSNFKEMPVVEGGVLTQEDALLKYYRLEAKPDMPRDQIDWMRKVSERWGFSAVMLRYALATGLNGQPSVASVALARICKIHSPENCHETREAWIELQKRYPELLAVDVPEMPPENPPIRGTLH